MSVVYKQYNRKRSITNHILGSTIFVSQYPKFWNPYHQKYSMLPRPYKTCQTNGNAKKIINDPWFKTLLFDVTIYYRLHLQLIIMQSINFSEQYIP